MKAYDGAAMIADKADAWLVPVRIEGPERSPFGYLRSTQIKKALFPQGHGDVSAARASSRVRSGLRGQGAPAGRGPGACRTSWSTQPSRRRAATARCLRRWSMPSSTRDTGKPAVGRSARHQAQLRQADPRRPGAGRASSGVSARPAGRDRRHAAELGRRRRDVLRPAVDRPRAGHDQFHQRRRQRRGGLPRRQGVGRFVTVACVRREGAADRAWSARSADTVTSSTWRTCAQRISLGDKVAGMLAGGRQRCRAPSRMIRP